MLLWKKVQSVKVGIIFFVFFYSNSGTTHPIVTKLQNLIRKHILAHQEVVLKLLYLGAHKVLNLPKQIRTIRNAVNLIREQQINSSVFIAVLKNFTL